MMTLSEFIELGKKLNRLNHHIKVPDFETFYARFGRRYLDGNIYPNVFDIATVSVREDLRGTGVFTRFFHQFRKDYPDINIYVENAAPRFQKLLLRLGFKRLSLNPECFYYLGDQYSKPTSMSGTQIEWMRAYRKP